MKGVYLPTFYPDLQELVVTQGNQEPYRSRHRESQYESPDLPRLSVEFAHQCFFKPRISLSDGGEVDQ